MLLQDEEEVLRRKAVFAYSTSSVVFLPLLLIYLYLTESYLTLGHRRVWPLFVVLSAFELIKWSYFQYQQETAVLIHNKKASDCSQLVKSVSFGSVWRGSVIVLSGVLVWFAVAILFGAEFLNCHEETLMFGALMSVLTVFPVCLNIGHAVAGRLLTGWRPTNPFQRLIFRNTVAASLGAWVGAIVIPLDWDRPWQIWPIPCSFGALLGYTLSHFVYFLEAALKNKFIKSKLSRKKR